ncbi:MAG: Lsr2 family DNA-binding protein [Nocardioidaceae bacterium]
MRAWARAQGMDVKAAGRMPAAVISAYNDAHS